MRYGAVALLFTLGCAVHSSLPPLAPTPAPLVPLGINAAYHGPLPPEDVQIFCGFAEANRWIRTPQLNADALNAYTESVRGCGLKTLALVEAPSLSTLREIAAAQPDAIETGNELELSPYNQTPAQYAHWQQIATTELSGTFRGEIVLGGVYALTDETKQAITQALALVGCPRGCIVGVHLYDASDEDLRWLAALPVRVWVTEMGSHTNCDPAKRQEQADWIAAQRARFSAVPNIERVFVYQWPTAPAGDCSNLGTYGIDHNPLAQALFQ